MYEVVDQPDIEQSRRGMGKTPERLAIENLPVGKAVYIPKVNAPYGSMAGWSYKIGKERGIKISVHDKGDTWLVIARGNT